MRGGGRLPRAAIGKAGPAFIALAVLAGAIPASNARAEFATFLPHLAGTWVIDLRAPDALAIVREFPRHMPLRFEVDQPLLIEDEPDRHRLALGKALPWADKGLLVQRQPDGSLQGELLFWSFYDGDTLTSWKIVFTLDDQFQLSMVARRERIIYRADGNGTILASSEPPLTVPYLCKNCRD
jgi:hypothetical protein